jgi:tetratricopeptide (TPR) repeat protein
VLSAVVAQTLNYQCRWLPTSAAGYFARGMVDYEKGDYEDAVGNFSKSIERAPQDAESYIVRGEAYAKLHDFGKAMPDLEKAVELRPGYAKAHAAYGDGKAEAGNAEGAIAEYSTALAADPNYGRCFRERGKLLYDAGKWDDAAADLRRGANLLIGDGQITAQLLLWVARAHAGEAAGATNELAAVLKEGRIRGDRFRMGARFLCGELAESPFLAAADKLKGDANDERRAEAFFLAGAKRLVFGDRQGALPLLQKAVETEADTSYAYDRARLELARLLRPDSSEPTR